MTQHHWQYHAHGMYALLTVNTAIHMQHAQGFPIKINVFQIEPTKK